MDKGMLQYLLPVAIMVIVLGLRMRSMSRPRPVNAKAMWILPLLIVAVAMLNLFLHPPSAMGWILCLTALAAGSAIGWYRGKMIHIWRDASTGQLMQKASPWAMLLLIAIIGVRFALRAYFGANPDASGHMTTQAMLVTDALLLFAVGLLAATRAEMAIRIKRIEAGEEQPA